MSVKVSIHKVAADGEQVSTEINLDKHHYEQMERGVPLRKVLDPFFQLADDRLIEMNSRIIQANHMVRNLSPEAQVAIHNVMEILHGRTAGPAPAEVIKQEQAEMEQVRNEAEARARTTQVNEDAPLP